MTHDQLIARRALLLEQLQKHAVAIEQLKGALAFCEELLAMPQPDADPHAEPIPELDGTPLS